jgi:tRNA(fMet)-specific endonuclease VapC
LTYLLDTNTLIAGLNGDPALLKRFDALDPEDGILCAPVLAELVFGARGSARQEHNLGKLFRLAVRMRFEPFGHGAAHRFGEIKASLRKRGITKSDFDLAIACVALEREAVLVSQDGTFHDGSIEGLSVENWIPASS